MIYCKYGYYYIKGMSRAGYNYKRKALSIAKDFGYSEDVRNMISVSKSEDEISRIMMQARKGILK